MTKLINTINHLFLYEEEYNLLIDEYNYILNSIAEE